MEADGHLKTCNIRMSAFVGMIPILEANYYLRILGVLCTGPFSIPLLRFRLKVALQGGLEECLASIYHETIRRGIILCILRRF